MKKEWVYSGQLRKKYCDYGFSSDVFLLVDCPMRLVNLTMIDMKSGKFNPENGTSLDPANIPFFATMGSSIITTSNRFFYSNQESVAVFQRSAGPIFNWNYQGSLDKNNLCVKSPKYKTYISPEGYIYILENATTVWIYEMVNY